MKYTKLGRYLLALLLAAMAMVPVVSAANIRPADEILGTKYFQESIAPKGEMDGSYVNEYALVTVDSKGFMNDADTNHTVSFAIRGKIYQVQINEVPDPLDKNAKLIVRTDKGIFEQNIPKIKQYNGKISGGMAGDASLLLMIKFSSESYPLAMKHM